MNRDRSHFRTSGFILAGLLWVCLTISGCSRQEIEFLDLEESTETIASPEREDSAAAAVSFEEGTAAVSGSVQEASVYVDVCGAVINPGVYELEPGSRVFQAIEKAGGYTQGAAEDYVNRAQSVSDGQQIYIPTEEEVQEHTLEYRQISSVNAGEEMTDAQGKVNLNTADAQTLMTLNGIGEAKASAIIAYREDHGRFSSIEEIQNVSGIKEGTYSKIKDYIVV